MKYLSFIFIFVFAFTSCSEDFTPKPKAYPKIVFPEKAYKEFVVEDCPFVFEMPKYGEIVSNKTFFGELPDSPCWVDIVFKDFAGTIHLSYKEVDEDKNAIGVLMDDAHKMTFKHTIKAEYIEEKRIQGRKDNVQGLFYDVGGDAASALQFYLTDYEDHFVRGALYFETAPNVDSLRPVIDFFRTDLLHMFDTFEWEESLN
ncbi:MAG: hypothetical protein EA412_11860 [Chitinophagaceae bacterium]|nr:MAG: hypothetical protein EA412_11860 [Chitinophagaceae bacterium]